MHYQNQRPGLSRSHFLSNHSTPRAGSSVAPAKDRFHEARLALEAAFAPRPAPPSVEAVVLVRKARGTRVVGPDAEAQGASAEFEPPIPEAKAPRVFRLTQNQAAEDVPGAPGVCDEDARLIEDDLPLATPVRPARRMRKSADQLPGSVNHIVFAAPAQAPVVQIQAPAPGAAPRAATLTAMLDDVAKILREAVAARGTRFLG